MSSLNLKRTEKPLDGKTAGSVSGAFVAFMAAVTFGIALLTPPISGPLADNPISYPYTDILSRFPRDYIWMYPAMLLMILFMILMTCLYHAAKEQDKAMVHIGLIFAIIAAVILFADYFVQVSVIQPSLLKGEIDGISLLSQYNPHGLFVVSEEIGYLFMSLSFLFFTPVFQSRNKLDAAIRRICYAACFLSIFALVLISWMYGIQREYLFEVAVISINFIALIVLGILWSIWFQKQKCTERPE